GRLSLQFSTEEERVSPLVGNAVPIAVLTSGETASAAELFTAAMKRFREVHIVGNRTFGKGVYQSIFELDDDRALAYTGGEFRIDDIHRIHGVGIAPDATPDEKMLKEKGVSADVLVAYSWILRQQADIEALAKRTASRNWNLPSGNQWLVGPETPNQAGSSFLRPDHFRWLFFGLNLTFLAYMGFRLWVEIQQKKRRKRLVSLLEKSRSLGRLSATCKRLVGKELADAQFVPQSELLAEVEDLIDDGKTPIDAVIATAESAIASVQKSFNSVSGSAKEKAGKLLAAVDARLQLLETADCDGSDIAQVISLSDTARMLLESGKTSRGKDGTVFVNAWAHALEALRIAKQTPVPIPAPGAAVEG
ncbi:MAG: S41 family peptidase, partial [Cyanobacteria bacterium]|nr:S41 family peptidase [Cyanobacteriota bacterium]